MREDFSHLFNLVGLRLGAVALKVETLHNAGFCECDGCQRPACESLLPAGADRCRRNGCLHPIVRGEVSRESCRCSLASRRFIRPVEEKRPQKLEIESPVVAAHLKARPRPASAGLRYGLRPKAKVKRGANGDRRMEGGSGRCSDWRYPLVEPGVFVRVGRGAAAKEAKRRLRPDGVPGAGREEDGVARDDCARFAVDFHGPTPVEDEVDLFGALVVMPLGGLAGRQAGFGQALVLHGRLVRSRILRMVEPSAVVKGA